eukprot:CAMPEP_0176316096 /NCGR_PEP_ID=MMETSP0121_2-20121125/68550_1 /TAXON_ID=160619 /ORGANISM="Kryptoperidinium foliaceum, Strain CCMP 1326" /LENGTH=47 /DNA_ID= /DNA_START= /DNA_END= /DNA_ORIENTATION=
MHRLQAREGARQLREIAALAQPPAIKRATRRGNEAAIAAVAVRTAAS